MKQSSRVNTNRYPTFNCCYTSGVRHLVKCPIIMLRHEIPTNQVGMFRSIRLVVGNCRRVIEHPGGVAFCDGQSRAAPVPQAANEAVSMELLT